MVYPEYAPDRLMILCAFVTSIFSNDEQLTTIARMVKATNDPRIIWYYKTQNKQHFLSLCIKAILIFSLNNFNALFSVHFQILNERNRISWVFIVIELKYGESLSQS